MRRTFLLQMIAGGLALKASESQAGQDPIAGDWHLLGAGDDEVRVPQHRMDLRFRHASGQLSGAVLSRRDGSEMPLAKSDFDGSTLRFQMEAPNGKSQADMPTMTMTVTTAGKFEGAWINRAGEKLGPPLKLIRAGR